MSLFILFFPFDSIYPVTSFELSLGETVSNEEVTAIIYCYCFPQLLYGGLLGLKPNLRKPYIAPLICLGMGAFIFLVTLLAFTGSLLPIDLSIQGYWAFLLLTAVSFTPGYLLGLLIKFIKKTLSFFRGPENYILSIEKIYIPLISDFLQHQITAEAFQKRYMKQLQQDPLTPYPPEAFEIMKSIFEDADAYAPDATPEEAPIALTEEELRACCAKNLQKLQRIIN